MKKKSPPQLRLLVNGWTLMGYPVEKKPWSPERKIAAVLDAGFDGIASRPGLPLVKAAQGSGLILGGAFDVGAVKDVEPLLRECKTKGMVQINVQVCDHDTPTAKALPVVRKIIEVGDRLGLKPHIEMHRDTCTETPEKTYALADAYQKATGRKLRMNFDHSHPAIIKHLHPGNYWERLGVRLDLLRLSELVHFRPFNGHHCQIPITNGKGKFSPEFEAWIPFCESVLAAWLKGAKAGSELYVVPELGPFPGYALSCFPDVWKDTVVLGKEIRKIWSRQVKKWK